MTLQEIFDDFRIKNNREPDLEELATIVDIISNPQTFTSNLFPVPIESWSSTPVKTEVRMRLKTGGAYTIEIPLSGWGEL